MRYVIGTLIAIYFLQAGVAFSQDQNSLEGDYQALRALYESTNGDQWYNNSGWADMTPETMGKAVGIKVNAEGRVISVDMQKIYKAPGENTTSDGNNLTGALPESIGNLKKVTYFNVKQNNLSGKLPDSIGNMESLVRLSLAGQRGDLDIGKRSEWHEARHQGIRDGSVSGKRREHTNKFSGEIPNTIGKLQNLELLEIRAQRLTGELPAEIGNAKKLKAIFLNDNLLTGSLPDEWRELKEIVFLHLDNAGLGLDVPVGEFNGEVPLSWQENWTNLANIRLQGNNLSGPVPEFPNSRDIRYVKMNDNNFSGEFPRSYFNGNNSGLSMFGLLNNNLSGELPESVPAPSYPTPRNRYLTGSFHITNNNFTGEFPDWVQKLSNNTQFQINGNEFTGKFPKIAAENPNMRLFWIAGNNFSGILPDVQWGGNVLSILIDWNNFEGSLPESWKSIVENNMIAGEWQGRLWRFEARGNNLTGELPAWLAEVPTLSRIKLQGNKFTFKDILPNYESILNNVEKAASASGRNPVFEIEDQKPFGKIVERSMPIGEVLTLDLSEYDYEGNRYQWYKDGEPISGAIDPILTIENVSESNEGEYILKVENDALPELGEHSSEPIIFTIGENDGSGNNDDDGSDEGNGSDDSGNSSGSKQALFPDAPGLLSPIHLEERVSMNPQLQWTSVEGADYYILHMSRNNPHGMVLDVTTEDTTYTPSEILGDASRHQWKVRPVKDGEMGEWSEVYWFDTIEADIPSMADLVGPDHYSENVSVYPELVWENVEADHYRIRLFERNSSELILSDESENESYSLREPLEEETAYIWQVKSVKNGIEGAWSPRWEFTTGLYEYSTASPHLLSPDKGVEHETLKPTFEWESVDADKYLISVSMDIPTKAKVVGSTGDESSIIYEEVPETWYTSENSLDPETTYYWRVKAINDGVEGEWSETWEFRTPEENVNLSTYAGENAFKTELKQNYPNPFNPVTQIEFTLTQVQNVTLRVYNLAGRQVATLVDGAVQAGRHTATFDASNLASGVYIYSFISDTHRFTRKMTLVK